MIQQKMANENTQIEPGTGLMKRLNVSEAFYTGTAMR